MFSRITGLLLAKSKEPKFDKYQESIEHIQYIYV